MTDLLPALRRVFGFDSFRAGQEEVVRAAVEGRDTLALMPTGSGKSLTYQLAATLRPSPTLVLSPLIALMKDQVEKLPGELAATTTFVNSSLAPEETAARLDDLAAGRTRLLYAAPERLRKASFVETLRRIGVGLVVVDEVHCVSMWGHDFRPDYLFIRHALAELGEPPVLGMTATATPATAREIAEALGRELEVVRTSVVRTNLRYDVEHVHGAEDRLRVLLDRLDRLDGGSAIVYARSRRSCEEIARTLRGHGFPLEHYHAGLEPGERTRVQDDFVAGRIAGVVATTAFGMGIDKADVRLVCLVNYPDSLESYVQMVGRAGRDGAPSETLLLASPSDAAAVRRFALGGLPDRAALRRVYGAIRAAGGTIEPEALAACSGDADPRVLVGVLEQAGIVRRGYDAGQAMRIELPEVADTAGAAVETLLDRYAREAEARAQRIVRFAESRLCRHRQVAEHFGETLRGPCGACDVCAPRAGTSRARAPQPLPEDLAGAIVAAVDGLAWPLGRRSLVAMLRGSVSAPPSARRSASFGLLAAARVADVKRWVEALETAGALLEVETSEGYRVLRTRAGAPLPPLAATGVAAGPADAAVLERLRSWRRERSRADGVPAYVVFADATLHELAASKPASRAELARVRGFGPVKLERYGDEVLATLRS